METEHPKSQSVAYTMTWQDYTKCVEQLIAKIRGSNRDFRSVFGIPRGGLLLAVHLSHLLGIPYQEGNLNRHTVHHSNILVCDDVSDTGGTLDVYRQAGYATCTLCIKPQTKTMPTFYSKVVPNDVWVIFPWETLEHV